MDLHPAEALSLSDWEKPLGVRSNPEGTRDPGGLPEGLSRASKSTGGGLGVCVT